jgi:hypothetical protein
MRNDIYNYVASPDSYLDSLIELLLRLPRRANEVGGTRGRTLVRLGILFSSMRLLVKTFCLYFRNYLSIIQSIPYNGSSKIYS